MKITLLTGKTYNLEQEFDFPLKVNKSARAKKLTLRIDSKERIVVLTLPRYCSQKKAFEFIKNHEEWVKTTLQKLPERRLFFNGEKISLFGKEIKIQHAPERRLGVKLEGETLLVSGEKEFLHRRIKDYIKKKAKDEFYKRSKKYAQKLGEEIHDITIKDTKSRWGSCSSLNNLNYNWRISLAPEFVINYLIVHEVAHLKHQNHSNSFWQCVERLCPDYEQGERWLKEHGKELYGYE